MWPFKNKPPVIDRDDEAFNQATISFIHSDGQVFVEGDKVQVTIFCIRHQGIVMRDDCDWYVQFDNNRSCALCGNCISRIKRIEEMRVR